MVFEVCSKPTCDQKDDDDEYFTATFVHKVG